MGRRAVVHCHSFGRDEREKNQIPCGDYGNPVYALWTRWFLGQEQAYRVFSTDNEEKLGDGLETVLGFFDVISYFGQTGVATFSVVCTYLLPVASVIDACKFWSAMVQGRPSDLPYLDLADCLCNGLAALAPCPMDDFCLL